MKIAFLIPNWGWVYKFLFTDARKFILRIRPEFQIDIIHSRDINKYLINYDLIVSPIKYFWTYNSLFFREKIRPKFIAWVGGLGCYNRIRNFKIFKWVFVQSNSIVDEKKLSKTNYFIQPNGVDSDLFIPIKTNKNYFTGFIGNPYLGKNRKPRKQKRIGFLKKICRKANLSYYIHDGFRNPISRGKLVLLYNQFKVYICTSKWEGGSLPLLESASCGLPLISSPVGFVNMGLIKDFENGFICRTERDFLYAVNYFLEDESELIRFGKKSRELIIKDWCWKIKSKEWVDRLENILSN